MEQRTLGRTGVKVSRLGLGAAKHGDLYRADADVERWLHHALDAGVNFIDTAAMYNRSEERIGRFLAFPTLVSAGAVASLDRELEQAAELAGAGPVRRMTRIVAPALVPSLIGGWVLMFVLAMRELDAAILVPAANDTVMFRMFNAVHFGRDDFVAALALLILFVTIVPGVLWRLFSGKELEVLP